RIEAWNGQAKSRRLPGHAPPVNPLNLFVSTFTLGPWVAAAAALVWGAYRSRRPVATECTRCGKPFCRICKRSAEGPLYCADCVRLYLRKESAGIEAHVAQSQEMRSRVRRRDRVCRLSSLLFPGAHSTFAQKPVAGFVTLWAFFFFVAIAAIGLRLFSPRTLPSPQAWRVTTISALVVASVIWLVSQRNAWRESHGS